MLRVIFFLAFMAQVWSQESAHAVLKKSAMRYQAATGLDIAFQLNTINLITDDAQSYEGLLQTGLPTQFVLKTPGLELYSDGVTLWDFRPNSQQVLVKSLSDVGMRLGPSQILLQYLECEAKSMKVEKVAGESLYHIVLEPTEELRQFSEIEVWLSTKDLSPKLLKTLDYSENQVDYVISRFKMVASPDTGMFQWARTKGVEVIDMR